MKWKPKKPDYHIFINQDGTPKPNKHLYALMLKAGNWGMYRQAWEIREELIRRGFFVQCPSFALLS